jgi:HEAT repeat protein
VPAVVALLAAALGAAACASKHTVDPALGLQDPAAVRRMEALREVARTRDTRRTEAVIEMLDDEDPGVRLMAGAVLKDLTGYESDYVASAGPVERREQVLAWRAWWQGRAGCAAPNAPVSAPPGTIGVSAPVNPMPASPPPPPPPPPPPAAPGVLP